MTRMAEEAPKQKEIKHDYLPPESADALLKNIAHRTLPESGITQTLSRYTSFLFGENGEWTVEKNQQGTWTAHFTANIPTSTFRPVQIAGAQNLPEYCKNSQNLLGLIWRTVQRQDLSSVNKVKEIVQNLDPSLTNEDFDKVQKLLRMADEEPKRLLRISFPLTPDTEEILFDAMQATQIYKVGKVTIAESPLYLVGAKYGEKIRKISAKDLKSFIKKDRNGNRTAEVPNLGSDIDLSTPKIAAKLISDGKLTEAAFPPIPDQRNMDNLLADEGSSWTSHVIAPPFCKGKETNLKLFIDEKGYRAVRVTCEDPVFLCDGSDCRTGRQNIYFDLWNSLQSGKKIESLVENLGDPIQRLGWKKIEGYLLKSPKPTRTFVANFRLSANGRKLLRDDPELYVIKQVGGLTTKSQLTDRYGKTPQYNDLSRLEDFWAQDDYSLRSLAMYFRDQAKKEVLGISCRPLSEGEKKFHGDGLFVGDVLPDSLAKEAGIQPADYILEINGKRIKTNQELKEAWANNKSLVLKVERFRKILTIHIKKDSNN